MCSVLCYYLGHENQYIESSNKGIFCVTHFEDHTGCLPPSSHTHASDALQAHDRVHVIVKPLVAQALGRYARHDPLDLILRHVVGHI